MNLVVTRLTQEAQDVLGVELRAADFRELPEFTAGAHVDLHLPNGLCRQYSLANSPLERHRYVLGVGMTPASRGGSAFVHQRLAVGDVVQVSEPRALFGIEPGAEEHLFIAGGIGITPILSMIHWCEANGSRWRLLYCVRTRARAAYAWTLAPHRTRVTLHVDQESTGAPDLKAWLNPASAGAHVYCCGPSGLMDAVAAACAVAGVTRDATHFERFSALTPPKSAEQAAGTFTAVLRRTGKRIAVRADQSLLDALEANNVGVPFSCREGLCRSCETPLLGGEADHRDFVLSDAERAAHNCILPCVSRARSAELVLDL